MRAWGCFAVVVLAAAIQAFPAPPALPCADCHGEIVHGFFQTRHAAALTADGRTQAADLCGSCHGEVSSHNDAAKPESVPVEFRFKDPKILEPARASERCMACHGLGMNALPIDGSHLRAGLSCVTCHSGMGKGTSVHLLKRPERELCGACHAQALAPFRSGHRPDASGALCTFCHDPHARERRLPGRACGDCHKAMAYPRPFEHPPVEEGCDGCHEPHGTGERFLLKEARPALCLSCHSQLEAFHRPDQALSPFRLYEACQNCHPRIHGSDSKGGQRFQR